jgi:hypothetical protein
MLTRDTKQFPLRLTASAPSGVVTVVRRIDEDRTCAEPGCATHLSAYNTGARCWQHESRRPFVQHLPRKAPPRKDDAEVLQLMGPKPPSDSGAARMPGPVPEPDGPDGPPPVPQPEPGPPPAERG